MVSKASYLVAVVFALLSLGCTIIPDECSSQRTNFDDYVRRSELPITEDPNSLCHGMNMGTGFSELEPKWAVGKLTGIDARSNALVFEGENKSVQIWSPTPISGWDYEVGAYYKIDMNNICRSFFMMADSRYPSPITATFVKPEKVNCAEGED